MLGKRPTNFSGCFLVVLALSGLVSCKPIPVPTVHMLMGRTMGTSYSIKLVPFSGMPSLSLVSEQVQQELLQVNEQMSTYIDSSELSKFNQQQSLEWVDVSAPLAQVVSLALEVSKLTEGAFDASVGPLVDLWGFGPDGRPEKIPNQAQIAEAMEGVGYTKIETRLQPPALRKLHAKLQLDLSAIAKGHGVDRVAGVLDGLGFEAYFVEIGGEVRTRGCKLDGSDWQVGIERPTPDEREIFEVVGLSGQSLATSGNYRNFYEIENQRYSHTIDPRTGSPVQDQIVSASVVADNCALADALATSMMAVGFERGLALAGENGWAVLLIAQQDGQYVPKASPSFQQQFPDACHER